MEGVKITLGYERTLWNLLLGKTGSLFIQNKDITYCFDFGRFFSEKSFLKAVYSIWRGRRKDFFELELRSGKYFIFVSTPDSGIKCEISLSVYNSILEGLVNKLIDKMGK